MPSIQIHQLDGTTKKVRIRHGETVMHAAVMDSTEGIDGECGGALSCGTCHVYVDESFLSRLSEPSEQENELLDFVSAERTSRSRLACQITMNEELDGLVIHIPAA